MNALKSVARTQRVKSRLRQNEETFFKLDPESSRCHWEQSLDDSPTSHKHRPSDFWRSIGKIINIVV